MSTETFAIDLSRPYRIEGRVFVQRVLRATKFVGVEESVWQMYRDNIDTLRFEFPNGSIREISATEFEKRSILRGSRAFPVRLIDVATLTDRSDIYQ